MVKVVVIVDSWEAGAGGDEAMDVELVRGDGVGAIFDSDGGVGLRDWVHGKFSCEG